MAASCADYKENGREEKKEPLKVKGEGSKAISSNGISTDSVNMIKTTSSKCRQGTFSILIILNIVLVFCCVLAVLCGVVLFVHESEQINSLQKHVSEQVNNNANTLEQMNSLQTQVSELHEQVNNLQKYIESTCTLVKNDSGLNEDDAQMSWQHLQQNVSMLYDQIHELHTKLYAKITGIELNISQLNTCANSTNIHLRNLASTLSEVHLDLNSTTQDFQASKSAIEVDLSQLNAHANSTDIHLENLSATLSEVHTGLQRSISHLRAETSNNISATELELATYANTTNSQLRDHTSALREMQYNLSSTRQELLANKFAIEVLNAHANSTKLHLRNITSTLGELHNDIDDNMHRLSMIQEEHERNLHQITLNMSKLSENVSLSQQIHAQEIIALQFNISSLNNQISSMKLTSTRIEHDVRQLGTRIDGHADQIQRLSHEQARINVRMRELAAQVNSASTAFPLHLFVLLGISIFVQHL